MIFVKKQFILMIYLALSIFTLIVFYKLYKLFGRRDIGVSIRIVRSSEDMREALKEFDSQEKELPKKTEILKPQWLMLKQMDQYATESSLIEQFLSLFTKVNSAFAEGNIKAITPYVSDDIKQALSTSIKERKNYLFIQKFNIAPNCEIKEIHINDPICSIDAEFRSQQIVQIQDENGDIIDNPNGIAEDIINHWIFQKDYTDLSNPWIVVQMN